MTTTRDRERLDAVAMKTQRMDNSVAPVTGASEGRGKVVARQLTAAGVTVYVGSRDARRGQAAVDEIGGDARLLVLDVVIALTGQLAAEGAQHGIRANSISPGVIAIPVVQAQIDPLGDDAPMMSMVRTTADGRPGQPEDIAYAALFLASDEARFINGENLVVDGGATVILG
jgi:NAD(P)-dependent dehydrogenase (short-subunit alcohol dehydrogenase family)